MNLRDNPDLREIVAAEYVLGTLRGGARRRFEAWLRSDAALGAVVARWQRRLAPLAELGQAAPVPASVWDGIERRLQFAPPPRWWQFWRRGPARPWAALAAAAGALALVLALQLAGQAPAPLPQQVAALTDAQARTALVISADPARGTLDVRLASDVRTPDDRSLQLWAIDRAGKPRSLGVLPDRRRSVLALDPRALGDDVALLAISLEPKGGSPDPAGPTGPVLYKGSWARL